MEDVIELISILNQKLYFKEEQIRQNEGMSMEEQYSFVTFQNVTKNALFVIHTTTINSTTLSVKGLDAGLEFATSPLRYRKDIQFERAALAEMARKYLAVNATNTNLLPENVKMNVLMNCWYKEIDGEY